MILSYALILPMSQLQTHQLMLGIIKINFKHLDIVLFRCIKVWFDHI